jgi:tetratricopeptide (TPR) repeat protein
VSKLIEGEKSAAEVTILTQVAGRPLTLAYAAPEQLRAQHVTVAIDVYALGVVLFELVTGTRLYRATMPYALEQEILAGDIRRPSDAASDPRRARELRGDLDAIIFTALRNQPDQRYASAAAFADDLERHLAGEPVQARLDSRSYRLLRFITRNRLPVAAAGAIALAIGIGAGVALWQATIAREQAREATALNTFVLSLIKHADPMASQQTKRADLATLTAIEERIDREFQGTPTQLLRLRLTIGDAYRNRGEMTAAQRAYQHAIDAAAGVVPEDDLLLLAAHVRRADWRLIASADAADRLGRVIEVLRSKGAIGADLLIDALLIRHQLSKEFGVPTFPPSAHLFNAVGEALDVADRHFGVGSRQYLKAALPYAFLVDDSGDRPNAQRLIDESLREARQRADDVASSMEYHDVLTAHYTYLCATPRASEGLAGLWGALEQVRASHDDTSVRLEAHYSALGLCYERIADPTGYWLYAAAFDVAAARERPPSMPLMRRATIAMTWAIFVHDYAAAERYFLSAMENIAAISEPLLRERLSRNILMDRVCLLSYRGDSDDAERVAAPLLRALDNEPGSAPSRAEVRMRKCLSFAQRDNGRFDDAARTAQDLIERCRAHTEASHVPCRNRGMLALGRALLDAGRYDEALAIFDKRRKLPLRTEINPESALGAARALLALGHTAEATEWLQRVYGFWLSSPTPRSVYASEAEYWLGQAYLAGGDRRGHWMVAEARQALAASPLKLHRALAAQGTTASPPEVALRRQ